MKASIKITDPIVKKSEAISVAGNASRLASILGLTRQAVCMWGEYVPVNQVYRVISIYPKIKIDNKANE
jgi:hypothetical protein